MTDPTDRSAVLPAKPVETMRDWVRTAGDAAMNGVPVIGGSAAVLIGAVLKPKYEKRMDDWLTRLGEVVNELDRRVGGVDLQELSENDPFIDAVTRATQIALGTSLERKLEMLQAALTNLGTTEVDHDFLALRFLGLVEELGIEHFQLLRYSADPTRGLGAAAPKGPGTARALLESTRIVTKPGVLDLLLHDLRIRGMIDTSRLDETVLTDEVASPFVTALGKEFIDFVRYF